MKYDKYIKYNYFRKPTSEYLILNLADLKLITLTDRYSDLSRSLRLYDLLRPPISWHDL